MTSSSRTFPQCQVSHAIIVDRPLAELAELVGLPDSAARDVEASQAAFAVDPGVDADGVPQVERLAAALGRVAADDGLAGIMRQRLPQRLPMQHGRGLL